jgi:choline dehydrogenase-like flavoprotein
MLETSAVVIAAGAIDSTQILLRSISSDFPQGLGNEHGLLGRYLHDHPRQWWPVDMSRPMTAMTHPVYISRAPYDVSPPLRGVSMTIGLANKRLARVQSMYGGKTNTFGVQVFGTMMPRADSMVSLDPDTDDVDAPILIDTGYEDQAVADIASARDRFKKIFADLGIEAEPRGPFHTLHPGSSVHFGGTVRMHTSPTFGMLDARNRLHAVHNVVVADSSCFPTGPEKNPTLTSMAIAARAAHLLVEDLTS